MHLRKWLCAWSAAIGCASVSAADINFWRAPVTDVATVLAVQRALKAEGYDPGPADGTLNGKTVEAVKQAQKERELEPTGRLDRRTVAALGINVDARQSRPAAGFGIRQPGD